MTDKTGIYSARVPKEVIEVLRGEKRKIIESLAELVKEGKVEIVGDRLVVSEIPDCDGCPYMDELDMSKFDEVCEFKGLDRQKAIDRCAQMLWR